MSEQKKHHYKAVFKSDHLGVADIEDLQDAGNSLIFTIARVTQEHGVRVAGKKGNFNIAYFGEAGMKPWVLNSGNTTIVKRLCGTKSSYVEDWPPVTVKLYIDPNAQFGGQVTGGVRVLDKPITKERTWLTPDNTKAWGHAVDSVKKTGSFEAVLKRMNISDENKTLITQQVEALKNA